jgi:hypothetical protein
MADGPGSRSAPDLFYHPDLRRVLLINGSTGTGSHDHGPSMIWSWNGSRWQVVPSEDGPGGRSVGVAAYDTARDRLVIAGGYDDDDQVTDTWEWDGTDWIDRQSAIPDGVSNHMASVYDAARGQSVFAFGQDAGFVISPSTFGWNGSHWTELAETGPPSRVHYAIGYDPRRERVVLFGGFDPSSDRELGDTWEWDGATWTQVSSTGPSPRAAARLAYDASLGALVLFGGAEGYRSYRGDTWSWDGTEWRQVAQTGPSPRGYVGLAADESRFRLVLYGGYDGEQDLGDTWEWYDGHWVQADP